MKDQVDNLERNGITTAVTINGLLDPIERAKSFERVEDGSASILYISPESYVQNHRKIALGRKIVRFKLMKRIVFLLGTGFFGWIISI